MPPKGPNTPPTNSRTKPLPKNFPHGPGGGPPSPRAGLPAGGEGAPPPGLWQTFWDSSFAWLLMAGVLAILGLLGLVAAIAFAAYGKLWFQAYMSSADVNMLSLVGMGFRQVNSRVILQAKIMAAQ